MKSLSRYCDLTDPEEVKGIIATKYKNKGTQQLCVYAYDSYLKFVGGTWIKPKDQNNNPMGWVAISREVPEPRKND